VRTLLSAPAARDLFHRAILQSAGFEAPAFAPPWSYARAQTAAEKLFDALGSTDLSVLRAVATEEVARLSHELCGVIPVPGKVTTPANLVWMPVPDGQVVHADVYPGWPEAVPLMMGCTENEARYFIKPGVAYPPQALVGMASVLCGPKRDDVLALLASQGGTTYESMDRLFTAAIWFEPARATALKFAELGRDVYCYHFKRCAPGAIASQDLAKHTAEIRYVFGNLTSEGYYDEVDEALSAEMQDAWIAFARDGVPCCKDGSAWPVYRDDNRLCAMIDTAIRTHPFEPSDLVRALGSIRTPSVLP
jgi:para-nitrobenzyl esterase